MLHLADGNITNCGVVGSVASRAPCFPRRDSICIVNLIDEALGQRRRSARSAELLYPLDPTLDAFTTDGRRLVLASPILSCTPAIIDPVLAGLGATLRSRARRPAEASALFVDQVGLARQAHVAVTYGGLHLPVRRAGGLCGGKKRAPRIILSRPHQVSCLSPGLPPATCSLSRSYFIKAFKKTAGRTPHRWLLEHQVPTEAKKLLLHFTSDCRNLVGMVSPTKVISRVFANLIGMPPRSGGGNAAVRAECARKPERGLYGSVERYCR